MLYSFERYLCMLPECLGGASLDADAADYVDAAFSPDAAMLEKTGTLGFRRWDRTLGFLEETALDEYERAADGWGLDAPDASSALLLMRLTLYRLPLDYYARYASCWAFRLSNGANDETTENGEEYGRLCDEINYFRLLWLRLCFPDADFNADPMTSWANGLYRGFWRAVGANEAFLFGDERKDIAELVAKCPDVAWSFEDYGVLGEVVFSEVIFRNLAFWAVKSGLLSAIDAYAAGVPAAFL